MKAFTSSVIPIALAVLLLHAAPASAQTSVQQRVSVLEDQVSQLLAKVAALEQQLQQIGPVVTQAQFTTEVNARLAGETTLNSTMSSEAGGRKAADAAIQSQLDALA